jgi:O-Antigen ligase
VLAPPTLLAMVPFGTFEDLTFVSGLPPALFVLAVLLGRQSLLAQRPYPHFYAYFAAVGFATLLGIAQRDQQTVYEQTIALATLFAWTSAFISIYLIVRTPREYRWAMRLIDILGTLISLSVFVSYIAPTYFNLPFGEMHLEDGRIRAFGPFGDQVAFVIVYFALRAIIKRQPMVIVHCAAILFTGTRGAFLALVVGGLWLVAATENDKQHAFLRRRIMWGSVLALGSVRVFLLTPYGQTALDRIINARHEGSLDHRTAAATLGVIVFLDHPLAGVGFLGFNRLSEQYHFGDQFSGTDSVERATYTAQNQYVQTATDAGIPGLVVLVFFLWTLFKELKKGARRLTGVYRLDLLSASAWLVALAIGNQAAVWLLPAALTSYLFFAVCGLSLAATKLQDRRLI